MGASVEADVRAAGVKREAQRPKPNSRHGQTDLPRLKGLLNQHRSRYRDGPMEGVVVRAEDDRWLRQRVKLVRPEFTQQIESHWRKRALVWNHIEQTT